MNHTKNGEKTQWTTGTGTASYQNENLINTI